jgi:predicted nucleic acid-binding protein
MILYLDTSSLVKLYVKEADSPHVVNLLKASEITATSLIAYTESRAAFARRFREKAFSPREYKRLVSFFNEDWGNYFVVNVTKNLVLTAGALAEKHGLRGFDAIHLSSAVRLHQDLSSPVTFSCADQKLQKASALEDLHQPN